MRKAISHQLSAVSKIPAPCLLIFCLSLVTCHSSLLLGQTESITVTNASTTGTTLYTLTAYTSGHTAIILTTSQTAASVIGITTSGAGTSGSAIIQTSGEDPCVFDGPTTAYDYVAPSTTTGGDCHDTGSGSFAAGDIGLVLSTNGSAGTYMINLFPPGAVAATSGSGMSDPMTTAGDLIVGGTSGAASRLGIGSSGDCLTSNGTTAAWGSCGSGNVPTINSGTTNMVLTNNGSSASWVNKPVINVMTDYGAANNDSTDDTHAIQDAINACPSTGCTILFPAGAGYLIKGTTASITNVSQSGYVITATASNSFASNDILQLSGMPNSTLDVLCRVTTTGSTSFGCTGPLSQTVSSESASGTAAMGLMVTGANVRLQGAGVPSFNTSANESASYLVAAGTTPPMYLLTVMPSGAAGFEADRLGFRDLTSPRDLMGGILLVSLNNFELFNDTFWGFNGTISNLPVGGGAGITLDGGDDLGLSNAWAQWGTIVAPFAFNVNYGITTRTGVASVVLLGGDFQCYPSTPVTGTIGIDLGYTISQAGYATPPPYTSEQYYYGFEVNNCNTGVYTYNASGLDLHGKVEFTGAAEDAAGTVGYDIGGNLGSNSGRGVVGIQTTEAATGAVTGTNIENLTILGPIDVTGTDTTDWTNNAGQNVQLVGAGSKQVGTISISSSTTGSVTFAQAFKNTPVCNVTPNSTSAGAIAITSLSVTGLTATVGTSGTYTIYYSCRGNPN
jgi:hypothetical protein